MRKRIFIISVILCVFIAVAVFYQVINEKNYNDIMMAYVSATVTGSYVSFEQKVRTLRKFVHENIHPIAGEENRPDTVGIDKLIFGIGWCDQVSRVFMQLARKRGIKTRLLFLKNARF